MFGSPTRDQMIALAGVFQGAMLVYQLGNKEYCDEAALESSVFSLLRVDADSVVEVYSSVDGVRFGCSVLDQVFRGQLGTVSRPLFQYAVAMHQLALKLGQFPHMADAINQRLVELAAEFPIPDGNVGPEPDSSRLNALCTDIAELYSNTISTLEPRIMVQGSEGRLSNEVVVNRVRSALFAGIRSAYLWHQLGGRRWQLMLHRRAYQTMAARIGGVPRER